MMTGDTPIYGNPHLEDLISNGILSEVWHEEHQMLQELRFWAKDFRTSRGHRRFAAHSLCQSGWWKVTLRAFHRESSASDYTCIYIYTQTHTHTVYIIIGYIISDIWHSNSQIGKKWETNHTLGYSIGCLREPPERCLFF